MNKLMIGSAMGFMMGVGLMMLPVGKTIQKDVKMGVSKAKKVVKDMQPEG